MTKDDIELYLKAKDKFSYANVIYALAVLIAAMAALSTFLPDFHDYTKYLVLAAFIMGTSTYGADSHRYVSRATLLKVLERQINADPEALEYIAQRKAR
ncbi:MULTISPECIES: hypothetical protein [unclassified Marinimicrobium]|jgi:hypothetical protein|uniref:hypothetical protein n=1 Tax=unclassified Marinimicrobium TaxID=2632100 RepID=UPI0004651E89|nr:MULTISPECIES: hypothetical protein [unclassified Marinimicrobium]MAN50445.1 hypothetical protein [Marinimicrobium sp.]|tara:strand:- start:322 stop:618 length:297 start_codon:yes stop_codon:yes gene_type:complete